MSAGAGAGVVGSDLEKIPETAKGSGCERVSKAGFQTRLCQNLRRTVRQFPRGASRNFMRDIGERSVEQFHPTTICDLIERAAFTE